MRIIGGEYGSRRILSPPGVQTRPTLEQRRESLFNILQAHIGQSRVLDLFGGSGALGLEALSRGAAFAVFCDNNRAACRTIEENIRSLDVTLQSRVYCMDWKAALQRMAALGERYDLVFVDPPYAADYEQIIFMCCQCQILGQQGMMMVEHGKDRPLAVPDGFRVLRTKQYRDTQITFLENKMEAQHGDRDLSGQF